MQVLASTVALWRDESVFKPIKDYRHYNEGHNKSLHRDWLARILPMLGTVTTQFSYRLNMVT
jgi:hypothetical protein